MEIEVLVPVAPVGIDESPLASRLADLGGRRIGFLDNQKANAGLLLDHVVDELRQRVGTFEVVREAKIATAGSPPAVMDHLRQCEAVVLAIADWGSCTSWSVHDAVELERHGVPAVVICSDEFGPLGRAEAQALGLPGLPLVPIPHPLAGNRAPLVAAKASGVVAEVLDALTADATVLAEQHRGRFTRLTQRRLAGGAVCVDEVCAIDLALVRPTPS